MDFSIVYPVVAILFLVADVYALYRYLPGWFQRYGDRKFKESMEEVESIVYGLFTPTDEDLVEDGKIVQPKGTVPIVAALTPLTQGILLGLVEFVKTLPTIMAQSIGEEIRKGLTSVKMGNLGAIGNASKQLGVIQDTALAAKDPVLSFVKPAVSEWIAGNFGKKTAGGFEAMISMLPVNLTDISTGPVLTKLAEKFPAAAKLLEELKASKVILEAEKVG